MHIPPEATEQKIEHILSRFKGEREELIPILQTVQEIFGYLPEEVLKEVARFTSVPESRVYSTATFYTQFHFARRGRRNIKVCCGTACHVRGASHLLDSFERELGVECGGTTSDFEYNLERVACVGSCALAPVVIVDDTVFGLMEAKKVSECLMPKEGDKG